MITLYGYTILADLAVLAIVIVIFIFAASIYRGASELCIKEEEDAYNRRKELFNRRRREVTEKLKNIDDADFMKELTTELNVLNAQLNIMDKSILKYRNKAKAFTARNMVVIPSSFLLASMITSGIAIATSGTLPTIMWILSLASLASGLYFIYRNLSTVEFFSKIIDLSTLMEQALEKHAQKRSPIVGLEIWNPSLKIQHGETLEIHYDVYLKQGVIAKNARVRFSGTEELDFPDQKIEQLDYDYSNMRKAKHFWHGFEDVNPKEYKHGEFKVKAPDQPGEYTMAYWIRCDEFTEDEITFKIKVI